MTQREKQQATTTSGPSDRHLRVGIYGASGTTGTELTGLLQRHPACSVSFATSRSHAGDDLRTVEPAAPSVILRNPTDVSLDEIDLAFVCLPHGHAANLVAQCVHAGVPCIDLSGDLRLRDEELHSRIYGSARPSGLAERAVYSIAELCDEPLEGAEVVSNPGCYPTCVGLALEPLARAGWLEGTVVVNALSGISGAGRPATAATHFIAVHDDVKPYKLGRSHRHTAEMEQSLDRWMPEGQTRPTVIFNPHVVPMERGMLATITLTLPGKPASAVHEQLTSRYRDAALIEVLPPGQEARIRMVARTPRAVVGVSDVRDCDQVVLTSAIDNLLKGAASQAIQNMNRRFGFDDTLGLN